jgi:ankyrin repeat protein
MSGHRHTFSLLPPEILVYICGFLPPPSLASVCAVSTQFTDAVGAFLVTTANRVFGRDASWALLPRRKLLTLYDRVFGGGGAAGAADAAVFAAMRGAIPLIRALASREQDAVARARHERSGAGLAALVIEHCPGVAGGAALRAVLELGACDRAPAPNGLAPVHCAAAAGHVHALRVLFDEAASRARAGAEEADDAARGAARAAVSALANTRTPLGHTPLMFAATADDADALVLLIELGADVDAVTPLSADAGGECALHSAAASGNVRAILALLDAGADPNRQLRNKRTPLLLAVEAEAYDAVHALLTRSHRHPVDLALTTDAGKSAVYVAADRGLARVVKLLLDAGADPLTPTHRLRRALCAAAERGHADVVRVLVDADVQGRTSAGCAPSGQWAQSVRARVARQAALRSSTSSIREMLLDHAGADSPRGTLGDRSSPPKPLLVSLERSPLQAVVAPHAQASLLPLVPPAGVQRRKELADAARARNAERLGLAAPKTQDGV